MDTNRIIKPCDGYEESLILSRYGELGPEEEKALGAHLSGCPACRAYMEGLGRTLAPLPANQPGPFEAKKAARVVMERIKAPHGRPVYTRYLAPAFATLAIVAVAAWFSLNQTPVVTNAPVPAPVTVASGAPANVIANATGHQENTHAASAQQDVEIAHNVEMIADLDLMEDIDTVDRIERL